MLMLLIKSLPVLHLRHLAVRLLGTLPVVDLDGDVDRRIRRVGQKIGTAHGALAQPEVLPDAVLVCDSRE